MSRHPVAALAEFLRIDAVKRVFSAVNVQRGEAAGLVGLAAGYALLEGVGLSLLLPVLQYAEAGPGAAEGTGGALWAVLRAIAAAFHLPISLLTLLALAFLPILLRQAVFYWNAWYSALVSNRIATRLRVRTFARMMNADPGFFEARPVGELAGMVLGQTTVAGTTVLNVIREFSIILLMALYAAILLFISAPLTLVVLAFAVVVSLLVRSSIVRSRSHGARAAEVTQSAYAAIVERLSLVKLVKLRHQEANEVDRVLGYSEDMAAANVRIARLGAQVEVTADPVLMLAAFVTLFVGISVMGLKLAELGMLLFVLTRLNAKVKEFNAVRQAIASGVASIGLVTDIQEQAAEENTIVGGVIPFSGVNAAIEFRDVCYSYADGQDPALEEVNATIPAGSFTAIVGRSGAGKSTMVELLPRLKDASSGSVLFDGVDVREFDLGNLRRGIGYLTQDPMLFNASVRANLTYGMSAEVEDSRIEDALTRAYAQFVLDLPAGLDTVIGDRGIRFSGGERQRVALARVLLEDPSILILDEPTSALDSESEGFIQRALEALHGSKTIIVIAHRLATVVAADQLLVMAGGRVVQAGTHAQLVNGEGPYGTLFESQLLRPE